MVITVFSAPNYCDSYGNQASFLVVSPDKLGFESFSWVEHPFVLPNNLNAFSYSYPLVAEHVTGIVRTILANALRGDEPDEADETVLLLRQRQEALDERQARRAQRARELEELVQLHGLIVDVNGLHLASPEHLSGLRRNRSFEDAKELDQPNEALPRSRLALRRTRSHDPQSHPDQATPRRALSFTPRRFHTLT